MGVSPWSACAGRAPLRREPLDDLPPPRDRPAQPSAGHRSQRATEATVASAFSFFASCFEIQRGPEVSGPFLFPASRQLISERYSHEG